MLEREAGGRVMAGGSLVSGKARGSFTLLSEGRGLRRGLGWVLERASGCGMERCRERQRVEEASIDREGYIILTQVVFPETSL